MRVAIFQDTWRPSVDGVVTSTELFVSELKRQGHEVLVVVPAHPNDDTEHGDDVVLVPSVNAGLFYPGVRLGKFWRNDIVAKKIIPFAPDVIHSMTEFTIGHFMATYWQNRLGKIPRVHTFHTLWTEYLFYIPLVPVALTKMWMRWAAPRSVRKRLRHIIAPSAAMREALIDDWRIGNFPVSVVSTGIQIERFKDAVGARFRERHKIADDEKVVLYLGRLGDEKNVELVIGAMAELRRRGHKKLRFVVAGGGPQAYVSRLHKLAEKEKLTDIIWTGFIRGADWLDCYGSADLFLFPSVTETQGLVVIESLAAGVPLVSVRSMGPASVMEGERGCLFADNDAKDFADKAERLLFDDALHAEKRREGLALAEEYSIERRTRDLVNVYEEAVSGRALTGVTPRALPA